MNRRLFLTDASKFGLSLATLSITPFSLKCFSQPWVKDHFFVQFVVEGGWDVTLCLDPKSHSTAQSSQKDLFLEYRPEDIIKHGEIEIGPAASALKPYLENIAIVNGIQGRRDPGHPAGVLIMSTGFGDGLSAALPVELAATMGSGSLGVLTLGSAPETGHRKVASTQVSSFSTQQMVKSGQLDLLNGDQNSVFGRAKMGLSRAAGQFDQLKTLRESLKQNGLTDEAATLAASFKSGIAQQAYFAYRGDNIDSHTEHEGNHFRSQAEIWGKIAEIFKSFKQVEYKNGASLFDHTTFSVVSEFSRTPALNGGKGKDHNPNTNSVLFAGRGINGGAVIGQSHLIPADRSNSGIAEHRGLPINFENNEAILSGRDEELVDQLIFPETIASTVGNIFGSPNGIFEGKELPNPLHRILKPRG